MFFIEPSEPTDPDAVPGRCYEVGRGSDFSNVENYDLADNSINPHYECRTRCYAEGTTYGAIRFRSVSESYDAIQVLK